MKFLLIITVISLIIFVSQIPNIIKSIIKHRPENVSLIDSIFAALGFVLVGITAFALILDHIKNQLL